MKTKEVRKIQEASAHLTVASDRIKEGRAVPCSENINQAKEILNELIKIYYKK